MKKFGFEQSFSDMATEGFSSLSERDMVAVHGGISSAEAGGVLAGYGIAIATGAAMGLFAAGPGGAVAGAVMGALRTAVGAGIVGLAGGGLRLSLSRR